MYKYFMFIAFPMFWDSLDILLDEQSSFSMRLVGLKRDSGISLIWLLDIEKTFRSFKLSNLSGITSITFWSSKSFQRWDKEKSSLGIKPILLFLTSIDLRLVFLS